jgi:hypothetical protein
MCRQADTTTLLRVMNDNAATGAAQGANSSLLISSSLG